MDLISTIIDWFLHLDMHLNDLVVAFGPSFYAIMFLVVFCETGLVVTPLLPGDSLLFAVGALAAIDGSPLDVRLLAVVFFCAALCGDVTNYTIGRKFGPRLLLRAGSRLLNQKHLDQTQAFYARHGGKTIILARFMPIVRTFAPFVAGIGHMSFKRFASFSVVGAALWIVPFLLGGYYLGNRPEVKTNFHIIVVVILVLSVMPPVISYIRSRRAARVQPAA